MCGICGIYNFDKKHSVNPDIIRGMCNVLKHRGPDDDGVYISKDKKVGLGQRRLSIIDLSSLGHQPMNYRSNFRIYQPNLQKLKRNVINTYLAFLHLYL